MQPLLLVTVITAILFYSRVCNDNWATVPAGVCLTGGGKIDCDGGTGGAPSG